VVSRKRTLVRSLNQLNSKKLPKVHQASGSGSGPGGRWFKCTRPDHSFEARGSLTNFIRYAGREFDTGTGLYFYRGRYYDPQAGRFLTEDLSGFGAGANFYAYVRNSPINLSDPLSLCPEPGWCPSNIKNFFDTLTPYFKDMSDETGTDWTYFAALSAFESRWLRSHAQSLDNPFGLTNAGATT